MRKADVSRTTGETDIKVSLDLDGTGKADIETGAGFLNHMLRSFARHGRFDLAVKAAGDIDVDFHHTTEDTGIVLGEAFLRILADKRGIRRFGSAIIPMDEALSLVAEKLHSIKQENGPGSIGLLTSAKCTNEENYLMNKFARAVLGTNNIDHCARL